VKVQALFLSLLFAAASHAESTLAIPGFLPQDTKVVIGIQVRALIASPITKAIIAGLGSNANAADLLKLTAAVGFNPLSDVDDVLIATSAKGDNPPALIVAHGRFDRIQADGGELYHGVRVHEADAKGKKDSAWAILDASTAIAGDLPLVHRAIDRRSAAPQLDPAVMAILNALRTQYDIWGYGQINPAALPAAAKQQGLDAIDRFQFGVNVSSGLQLAATLHMRSTEDGQKIAAGARMIEAMVKSQQPSMQGAQFDIKTDNETVKIALSVSEEELNKAIQARLNPSSAPARPQAPPKPAGIQKRENGDSLVVTLPGPRQ
jgi:hypothetical protein